MADNASTFALAFHDVRWNSWRWRPILERWGDIKVFANERILKTATFIAVNDEPISTVFFIRVKLGATAWFAHYAVTAYHGIKDRVVSILFNAKTGVDPQHFVYDDWITDTANDIAITPIDNYLKDDYDIEWIDLKRFAFDENNLNDPSTRHAGMVTTWDRSYGTGSEIFSIGLFEGHTGTRLAQPVARFGHIAMQPAQGEKVFAEIETDTWTPIDGYLVEMAAWRGQSGSPVFHHRSGIEYLVGMIQGLYPGEQDVEINDEPFRISGLGLGIGIVIPASEIAEVLMTNDKLKKDREDLLRRKVANPKIKPRAASRDAGKDEPLTRTSFNDMLKKASRKISEPESEDSETSE